MSYLNGAEKRLAELEQEKAAAIQAAQEALQSSLAAVKELLETLTDNVIYKALPSSSVIRQTVEEILEKLQAETDSEA